MAVADYACIPLRGQCRILTGFPSTWKRAQCSGRAARGQRAMRAHWLARKADERAYVYAVEGAIEGFLYLKREDGALTDVTPPLPPKARIKVGTLKINPHGTRLGERFVKKIFDHALHQGVAEIYVTAFPKHAKLIELLQRYGFEERARKTMSNGTELVLVRDLAQAKADVTQRYPRIATTGARAYLLALYPRWHTRLLPDSILANEDSDIVTDVSHTNSIHKVYLAGMRGMEVLRRGDILVIYRTNDGHGAARYRSVATSLCVLEEYRHLASFATRDEFMAYCKPYSVFSDAELEEFWRTRRYPHVIRFLYNTALRRRPTREQLIAAGAIDEHGYAGFQSLTLEQLRTIATLGEIHAGLVVDQA